MNTIEIRDDTGKYICQTPKGDIRSFNETTVAVCFTLLYVLLWSNRHGANDMILRAGGLLVQTLVLGYLFWRRRTRRRDEKLALAQQQV